MSLTLVEPYRAERGAAMKRRAEVGEEYTLASIDGEDGVYCVAPKCDGDEGNWICLTDDLLFRDENEREEHFETPGEHVLAWSCTAHGPEVP
jgi:hypothetical protein